MQLRTLCLISLLSVSMPMMASTVYTYTGSDFNFSEINNVPQNPPGTVVAPYNALDSVTGSFTLAGNVNSLSFAPVAVSFFSFNDGVQTIDSSNGSLFADISTDASGNIINYVLQATIASSVDLIQIGNLGSPAAEGKFQVNGNTVVIAETNTVGSFKSATVTPEPSSLMLLGTGLLGLAGVARRKLVR